MPHHPKPERPPSHTLSAFACPAWPLQDAQRLQVEVVQPGIKRWTDVRIARQIDSSVSAGVS